MNDQYLLEFSSNAKQLVFEKYKSVSACAREAGFDRSDLSRFLKGQKDWGIKKVMKLGRALGKQITFQ